MLTGRIRKGQQTDLRRAAIFTNFSDEARLDAVEQLIALADQSGLRPARHRAPGASPSPGRRTHGRLNPG